MHGVRLGGGGDSFSRGTIVDAYRSDTDGPGGVTDGNADVRVRSAFIISRFHGFKHEKQSAFDVVRQISFFHLFE